YFDLRNTSSCRRNTGQLESSQSYVVRSHLSFALYYVNVYCRLVICRSGEDLTLLRRDRRISLDELGSYAAQSFDGQRQRSDIQQEDIVYFACQYACLDSGA